MTKEEALDLIPLYAMGLLDATEAQALERFLAQEANSSLRAELQRYQAVTEALPLLVKSVPAPDLRASLQQRLVAQQSPQADATPPAKKIIPFWQERRFLGAVAVLVMVLGLGLWLGWRDDKPTDDGTNPTEVARKRIVDIVENPNTRQVEISAEEEFASISGKLFIDHNHEYGVLQLANIDSLPTEQAYQLWLMKGEDVRWSAAVFNADDSHTINLLVKLPTNFTNFQAAGVTIEPAGGSDGPTGDLVFQASLEK